MFYDLIIIGGGPAGIAGGIYAARKVIKTLLITNSFGGQSVNSADIQNFIGYKSISGSDFSSVLESQLKSQNEIEIKEGVVVVSIEKKEGGFLVTDSEGKTYSSKTLLLAMGSNYKKLNVPGEKEFEGKGVFYCSICDAPLMRNKEVAVIGGGNSGLEATLDLIPYASKIYLLNRSKGLKGDLITQEKVKASDKVKIITEAQTKEILGDAFVNKLVFVDLNTQEEKDLSLSGVFVEIGYTPNTQIVQNLVNLNQRGQIIVDHQNFQTSCPGIWAAGDITDSLYNQINLAIGDGVKAALNIYDFLRSSG